MSRLRKLVRRTLGGAPAASGGMTLIDKVAKFVACEVIEGDYLEFGVFRGGSFIESYRALERQALRRLTHQAGGDDPETAERRRVAWQSRRYLAFDSFEGLPELTADDRATDDFAAGQYSCSVDEFSHRLGEAEVSMDRVRLVPGWFEETCVPRTREEHNLERAAVVWIDADLYSSTRTALEFVTDLLQDGTVLIFDDWFSYRGSPFEGEQRAFHEWSSALSDRYHFSEYQRESWKRMSFIVSEKR